MICIQLLKLEGCELTDCDIFNVLEINCKVKYLCLRYNKSKPWQPLALRFPVVEHLDVKRNKLGKLFASVCLQQFTYNLPSRILVDRIEKSYEENKLEHCTRIDVNEWDYRSEKFFRAFCPSLKYVNDVELEQIMGTQDVAATTGGDDEGCTSVRENQMACTPTDAIKQYACRQSGNSGKKPDLKDLPEHLVRKLIATGRDWAAMTHNERRCSSTGRNAATAGTHCSANVWGERLLKFGSGRCATENSFLDRNEGGSASTTRFELHES
ncbi:unnamed protein product [Heligmosomoides polygyrus]|uniref:Leucine-rich repeat protein n=1 Tax=Heligmosomoides polygyrus TaxID=6339 RepID=A0A183FPT2_HELPZ|nr:unnamed protein product [Heligmosomoides polygyrus]